MASHHADIQVRDHTDTHSRRVWYWAGAGLVLLSVPLREPLLIVAGLLSVALGGVPALWFRFCLCGITVQRTLNVHRAMIGDEVLLTLRVENQKMLPVPRLDVEDEVPEEGLSIRGAPLEPSPKAHHVLLVNTLSLRGMQRVIRRYSLRCLQRGVYTFGPLRLESGDPFGQLRRERRQEAAERLIVYPLVVPIDQLGLPARVLLGEHPSPVRLMDDPLRFAGVRDYAPGDTPRRVHWKATARTGGRLQSKLYEPSAHHTLALFVDLRTSANPALLGNDPALMELAVCAAASVAAWGLKQGYAVGLYAHGVLDGSDVAPKRLETRIDMSMQHTMLSASALRHRIPHVRILPSTDPQQIVRVQETLAQLLPAFSDTMSEIVTYEASRLPRGSTIVYVGTICGLGSAGVEALRQVRAQGFAVTLVLTDDDVDVAVGELPTTALGGSQTWHMLLGAALGTAGVDLRGEPLPTPRWPQAGDTWRLPHLPPVEAHA